MGTKKGNTAYTKFGKRGGAYIFDGSADYIDYNKEINFNTSDTFTISVWAKLKNPTPNSAQVIVGKSDGDLIGYSLTLRGDQAGDPRRDLRTSRAHSPGRAALAWRCGAGARAVQRPWAHASPWLRWVR